LYSTCIFCHSSLGSNEAIEHFPVGRRIAFDGAKGRLWAVCRKCGRWNLTPLEERWEAIEECEKQFRGTRLRSSTDQIGLGRISEGTDLIRIGDPLRPEFAAWRYGRHFAIRRRYKAAGVALGLTWQAGTLLGGIPVLGIGVIGAQILLTVAMHRSQMGRARSFIREQTRKSFGKRIFRHDRVFVRIVPSTSEQGWALRFALDGKFADFEGREAVHTAHLVAPAMNAAGATAHELRIAVREIELAGSPEQYFRRVLKFGQAKNWHYTGVSEYPTEMRLAFEMASHEDTERAALEGELQRLESDWREAEEIASIADNMFMPQAISSLIEKYRKPTGESA
jgi:hypothetical protein